MPHQALIIAIQEYPDAEEGIAKKLEGTLEAGLAFRKWLEKKWQNEGVLTDQSRILFCSSPVQAGGSGATQTDILKAMVKLKEWRGMTDELYVYFSGHGFTFVDKPGSRADVIIASNFVDKDISGTCCLKLDEIIAWLRGHLGPGHHYYFVDACRNELNGNQVQGMGQVPRWDDDISPDASTYLLQSTVDSSSAAVDSGFAKTLLAGLNGNGRAKVWDNAVDDAMVVRYESLRRFVKSALNGAQKITSKNEGEDGETEAILARIRPIPKCSCTLDIDGLAPDDTGTFLVNSGRLSSPLNFNFQGTPAPIKLEPNDYTVSLMLNGYWVQPDTPVQMDLFNDRVVKYKKLPKNKVSTTRGGGVFKEAVDTIAEMKSMIGNLQTIIPPQAKLTLRNVATGDSRSVTMSESIDLPAGPYLATLCDEEDRALQRIELELPPGKTVQFNTAVWGEKAAHTAIASRLPNNQGALDFSESMQGPVSDPDLDVWLAILGAGRILGSKGEFYKISGFPLHDFQAEALRSSPVYVLAGFDKANTELSVSISRTPGMDWIRAQQPASMPGICEAYVAAAPGPQLVSLRIDKDPSYTIASVTSPNRVTLITLTVGDDEQFRIGQYLLPIGHLKSELPEMVRQNLDGRNLLLDVQFLARGHREFRKRRDLERALPQDFWRTMLYSKWLDPICCSMACYELLRRGKKLDLFQALSNMKTYFSDLPDTAALARLAGENEVEPESPPLFADGLRAFETSANKLPLPASHLDYSSPWTAWRAAH